MFSLFAPKIASRLPFSSRHFSIQMYKHTSYSIQLVSTLFDKHLKNIDETQDPELYMHRKLKQKVGVDYCCAAKEAAQLKPRFSADTPLEDVATQRTKYHGQTALTPHPVEVKSTLALEWFGELADLSQKLDKHSRGSEESTAIEANMDKLISDMIIPNSILPSKNLTPDEERERIEGIYLHMAEEFLNFIEEDAAYFSKAQKIDKEQVKRQLYKANKLSFEHVSDWLPDLDGNDAKTPEDIKRIFSGLQMALNRYYLKYIDALLEEIPALKKLRAQHTKNIEDIKNDSLFDKTDFEQMKQESLNIINHILTTQVLSESSLKRLTRLRDLVTLLGYRGEMRHFIRESAIANEAIYDDLVQFMHEIPKINALLQNRTYSQLSDLEKTTFHDYLRNDSQYFHILNTHAHRFSSKTKRMLDILHTVIQNQDLMKYIISDNKNKNSVFEVQNLINFQRYRMGEYQKKTGLSVNILPLCEDEKALNNAQQTQTDMVLDADIQPSLIHYEKVERVPGPSDIGQKLGELGGHSKLMLSVRDTQDALAKHKVTYQQLEALFSDELYGLGPDSQRTISWFFYQLYSTWQGSAACMLKEPGLFAAYLRTTVGFPSENTLRVEELRLLEKNYPKAYQAFVFIMQKAIDEYKAYDKDDVYRLLFKFLTVAEVADETNTSSRKASKAKIKDIMASRAIGMAVLEAVSLYFSRRFMSASGLVDDIPEWVLAEFPVLYQQSTVMAELVEKMIYTLAITNSEHAWFKVSGATPSTSTMQQLLREFHDPLVKKQFQHTLASLDHRAYHILQTLTRFFPAIHQTQLQTYFAENAVFSKPVNHLAVGALGIIAQNDKHIRAVYHELREDTLPRFNDLEKCLNRYALTKSSLALANVVLAVRADRKVMTGLEAIYKKRSTLNRALKYVREEEEDFSEEYSSQHRMSM